VPESRKSKDPLSSAPAKKWQPYGGYEPKGDRPSTPSPVSYAAPSSSLQTDTLSSAPAKKWQAYAGYEPKRDRPMTPAPAASSASYSAPASYAVPSSPLKTDTLSSAPAKKWQPYGGYEPKGDRPSTPSPAASAASYSVPAPASNTARYADVC
jgi:hypothetical protein